MRFHVLNTETNELVLGYSSASLEHAERHASRLTSNARGAREYAARRVVASCSLESCDCAESYDVCEVLTVS